MPTDRSAPSELVDECDRLRRLRDGRWYDALHYVRAEPEETDLLRQLRGNITRAHRLLVRLHVGSHSSAEAEKVSELLEAVARDFAELLILRPDVLLALGVRLEDI